MNDSDTVQCTACGFANHRHGLLQIQFDEDQPNVLELLKAEPLTVPCGNCGSPVASLSAAAFVDPENRVAACLTADERGEALAGELRRSADGWSFSVHRRPADCASVVRAHLASLAAKGSALATGLAKAASETSPSGELVQFVFKGSGPVPSRRMLSALAMLGGDGNVLAESVAPFIATRHSFEALTARTDATQALDAQVPPLLVSGRAGFLVGFGMSLGATHFAAPGLPEPNTSLPAELGAAPVLAAAWASDRTGATFERPGPAVWAECVVHWLEQHLDAAASLGPADFLRRTADNVQVANILAMVMIKNQDRLELIDAVEELGLLGGIDFAEHLEQMFGPVTGDQ